MRISDWSSDVCSSDLARGDDRDGGSAFLVAQPQGAVEEGRDLRQRPCRPRHPYRLRSGCGVADRRARRAGLPHGATELLLSARGWRSAGAHDMRAVLLAALALLAGCSDRADVASVANAGAGGDLEGAAIAVGVIDRKSTSLNSSQ